MKVKLITFDGVTKERSIAAYLLAKKILFLYKKSGILYTVFYLQQCNSSLMVAYGGDRRKLLPTMVKLNRRGYPCIIPKFHRFVIYDKSERADKLVKFYLSMFSLFRALLVAKRVTRETFTSIVTPTPDVDRLTAFLAKFLLTRKDLLDLYTPWINTIPLEQGIRFVPSYKSLPNSRFALEVLAQQLKDSGLAVRSVFTSCFPTFVFELQAYIVLVSFLYHSILLTPVLEGSKPSDDPESQQWPTGILWAHRVRFAFDEMNDKFSSSDFQVFHNILDPNITAISSMTHRPLSGKLAQAIHKGGSRRIFAIGNSITQRLLSPIHDWLMKVLRKIPMDYDQLAPLRRLVGSRTCHSVDFSSATYRFPLQFMYVTFLLLFGSTFAYAAVKSALASNIFTVGFVRK